MAAEKTETERVAVKTYVPAYQRDEWDDHADDLDMSRSEFVRSMVQAGRKGFDPRGHADESGVADEEIEMDKSGSTHDELVPTVTRILHDGPHSWEELFDEVTDNIEDQLESALETMQAENTVQYSGPQGGYVLVE